MTSALDQFVEQVIDSRLLSAADVRALLDSPLVAPCAGVQESHGLFGRARQVFPTVGGATSCTVTHDLPASWGTLQ